MAPIVRLLVLLAALSGVAVAALPMKAPLSKYTTLWTNSPFTSKPVTTQTEEANPLEDYVLIGLSPISGGHRVTLLNKQKPEERIYVDSDKPKNGFKIISIIRDPKDGMGTVVRMQSGNLTGNVAFDQNYLSLTKAPQAPAPGQVPPQTQPQASVPPGQNQAPPPKPRPRVMPPTIPVNPSVRPPGRPPARPTGTRVIPPSNR